MNTRINHVLCLFVGLTTALLSCQPQEEETSETKPALNLSFIDENTPVGDDFFRHANGVWLDSTEIPSDRSGWGSFHELFEYNEEVLEFVLAQATKGEVYSANSNEMKAAGYYAAGMDSLQIEQLGAKPLEGILAQINAVSDTQSMQDVLAVLHRRGVNPFYGEYVGIDDKKSDQYLLSVVQSGLGLPDRDYYFREDANGQDIITAYKVYMARLLTLVGEDSAVAVDKAEAVLALETKLATESMTRLQRRDSELTYNKMTMAEFQEMCDWLDWASFYEAMKAPNATDINVNQVDYMKALPGIVADTELETVKDYMKVRLISSSASYLSHDFVQAGFDFYSKKLSGQDEMRPRLKRVINETNGDLGDALSKLYVNEVFPPEAKEKCLEMVNNIKAALHVRIDSLDWMGEETKKEAHEKLTKLKVKIGYPDTWDDYSNVEISKDGYLENHWNAAIFSNDKNLGRLGQPIDQDEWLMAASVVNAYYYPPANEIVFPAGILQPPFYNYKADDAVNYGGIGSVIGHEITHGFDDEGRKYNSKGELSDWWTAEDAARFEARAAVLKEQFDKLTVQDTLNVNGQLTLGENIADLGGVNIAYDALQMQYAKNGRPDSIDGLSPEQRFFLSYGTIWRSKYKPQLEQRLLIQDTHAPAKHRVNGPLSNMEIFYQAFDIKDGDVLYKNVDERAHIW
ncbi:putative endopeptidase [Reichenbachiella agariperforans]|uniref:Putative endopeptidase n=1 Tax=Reichenbachiella agariperforans TaxID=156994 RepID=A0A1M6UVH4_REIAG|nr:M13 family metallopeptidase [Reichenbachiella agariperforans]SHK73189.1 putative endopeptidase [Reichenbachiella agariperforans]